MNTILTFLFPLSFLSSYSSKFSKFLCHAVLLKKKNNRTFIIFNNAVAIYSMPFPDIRFVSTNVYGQYVYLFIPWVTEMFSRFFVQIIINLNDYEALSFITKSNDFFFGVLTNNK